MHKDQLGNKTPYIGFEYPQCREGTIILAPLSENPNAPNKHGVTPIFPAGIMRHAEIVKILVPFIDNPNASDKDGDTPIYWAARIGHTEIVKILAPLTDSPNPPNKSRETPIYWAVVTQKLSFWLL